MPRDQALYERKTNNSFHSLQSQDPRFKRMQKDSRDKSYDESIYRDQQH